MKQKYLKLLILVSMILSLIVFFNYDLQNYLTLDNIKDRQLFYQQLYDQNQILSLTVYFIIIFLLAALSLPGITILIVVAGAAFFNFWTTLIIVSFADTLGSVVAFLASRYLFGDSLQAKHADHLAIINQGVEHEGAFYLFSLRLMPFFPCFLINLLMGLTTIRTFTFYWVTQIGKLPYKAIFANAGTQLGKLDSLLGLISPAVITSFVLIGLFPLLSKKCLKWFNSWQKSKV
ncbi:MAG: VTT domain-containing protein [Thermodesulfobacteriota bacterium]|nr:VTT domain-containing protein [Thermodesulfobacteriota bacterium]